MVSTLAEILPAAARSMATGRRLSSMIVPFPSGNWTRFSNRIANGLVSIGVKPGDRVSLFGANSWEWVASYYGIAKTGAVLNPLSSMLTTDELSYTLADAGARVVIGAPDKAPAAGRAEDGGHRGRCRALGRGVPRAASP